MMQFRFILKNAGRSKIEFNFSLGLDAVVNGCITACVYYPIFLKFKFQQKKKCNIDSNLGKILQN